MCFLWTVKALFYILKPSETHACNVTIKVSLIDYFFQRKHHTAASTKSWIRVILSGKAYLL